MDPASILRDEHKELIPHLDHILKAADSTGKAPEGDFKNTISAISGFLHDHLLDHAEAEERDLYPVMDDILREHGLPTQTMRQDHVAIGRMAAELKELVSSVGSREVSDEDRAAAARLLYGLAALLDVHFAKEEDVYLPLLSHLPDEDAAALADKLSQHTAH